MSRRRIVALASAGLLLLVGLVVVAIILAATQTAIGRDWLRGLAADRLRQALKGNGSAYLGRIHGNVFTGVVIDSLMIRDDEDSLVLATGPVRLRYDPRDLFDKRILLSYLEVTRPVVNLRRHADRSWNFEHLGSRKRSTPTTPRARSPERRLGDFVVIDSVVIHDGTVILTEPWSPPESLTAARRDSAVRAALASTDHEIRRTREGLAQTRRWTSLELRSPYVRLADPDSSGRLIQVGRLDVVESDPPFRFRNVRGPVRIRGDSVWFELAHFDLPGSTGRARGKVWWGSGLPTRYDVHVTGDSVSLADVSWVYPTLPRTGGGRVELTIRNDPRNLRVLDYALEHLDVRSEGSRLRGRMTFGVGGPVLVVKDVDLEADPVDFDLLRALNGGPFPVDWEGQFTGTVRGPGGPLDRWQLSEARLTFRDGHVPGAVSVFSARGGLDILRPSLATFRGLAVDVARLDLRTPRYLFPSFPRLRGTISGRATLDSVWTDVRFRDADLTHRDGPGIASHVTGSGRVTYGDTMAFDVDLVASPLSFTMLARSYPALALRGPYAGPLRVKGTMPGLDLVADLSGAAGGLAMDAHLDMAPPGLAARGVLRARELDLRVLLERPRLPATRLTGEVVGDVHGDSLATLAGRAVLALARSSIDSVAVFPSQVALAFGGGRMVVDSLRLETSAGRLTARGALGLVPGVSDTLRYAVAVDSLGGLRPYVGPVALARRGARERRGERVPGSRGEDVGPSGGAAPVGRVPRPALGDAPAGEHGGVGDGDVTGLDGAIRDSLSGRLEAEGMLIGSIDSLAAHGTVAGRELFVGGDRARRLEGRYALQGLPTATRGSVELSADSLVVAGVRLVSATARAAVESPASAALHLSAASEDPRGAFRVAAALGVRRTGPVGADEGKEGGRGGALAIGVDSARVSLQDHAWVLERGASIVVDSTGVSVDSLVLRAGEGMSPRIVFGGRFPLDRSVDGILSADSVPLADIGALLQTAAPLGGAASLTVRITGERTSPTMELAGHVTDLRYGTAHFPYFTVRGRYAGRRLETDVDVYRNGRTVLSGTAVLPVDLALVPVAQRLLPEPLTGHVRADSLDLGILEALSPQFTRASGAASTELELAGTWDRPRLTGSLRLAHGDLGLSRAGIRLRDVTADVTFAPERIAISRLSMKSGSQPNSAMTVTGTIQVPNYKDPRSYAFDLSIAARNFQVVDRRSVARLELSGALDLSGTLRQPVLGGTLTLDRGTFYISDLSQKQVVDLNDPELYNVVDTSLVATRGLFQNLPPLLDSALTSLRVPSLQVRVGDDVWLRSAQANIKLVGSMELAQLGDQRVSGTLQVSRGTYRLDLGVVQRTFQVDSGHVTFYGDPHIPAELDVYASYVVRQANRENRQDVKIIAHIGGTLREWRLELSSDERIPLSTTEILSYLVFGQPTLAATSDIANNNALRPVATALLPSVGAVLGRALSDQISFIDYVQVQTGSVGEENPFTSAAAASVLSLTRIGVGKQIGERTFVTANAGLCPLGGAQANTSFASSLGVTVEQRLKDGYSLQASLEPSSAGLQCRSGLPDIGSRPRQYGFDLFREWSF